MLDSVFIHSKNIESKVAAISGSSDRFADVTLACRDGQRTGHAVLLVSNSPVLRSLLRSHPPHIPPFIYFDQQELANISLMLEFLYTGRVTVTSTHLPSFLEFAGELKVKGLQCKTDDGEVAIKHEANMSDEDLNDDQEEFDSDQDEGDQNSNPKQELFSSYDAETDHPTEFLGISHTSPVTPDRKHKPGAGKLGRNPIHNFYQRQGAKSKCLNCPAVLIFNATTLRKHLCNKHPDQYEKYQLMFQQAWSQKLNGERYDNVNTTTDMRDGRMPSNPVHSFFTRIAENSKCNACDMIFQGRYPTTLKRHLASHPEQYHQFLELCPDWTDKDEEAKTGEILGLGQPQGDDNGDGENTVSGPSQDALESSIGLDDSPAREEDKKERKGRGKLARNPIHNFFERHGEKSKCLDCEEFFGFHATTLEKHLRGRHPLKYEIFRSEFDLAWSETLNQKNNKQQMEILKREKKHEAAKSPKYKSVKGWKIEHGKDSSSPQKTGPWFYGKHTYYCDQCEYNTKCSVSLRTHIESKHEGVTYECEICGKICTSSSGLRYHKQADHEGKRFHCQFCGRECKSISHLNVHVKNIHEGVKFPCKYCDYKATQKWNLTTHIKKVHGIDKKHEKSLD